MSKKTARMLILGVLAVSAALPAAWLLRQIAGEECRTYGESDRSLFNPDRGFYIQVKSSRPDRIAEAAGSVRVILFSFDLEGCMEEELPEDRIAELAEALETARKTHTAVVFRAAYGFHRDVAEPDEIAVMGSHIEQIAGVLNRYPEQILVVQAGMLGAYGEWHSSRYLEDSGEGAEENRLYILRQWEAFLDPGIRVAVRRPRFVREAEEEGILSGRLGIHNDALLSTDDDMGTYDDPGMGREEELLWAKEQLLGQANGGEMPTPGSYSVPENAAREFALLHLGYLNQEYNKDIISGWSAIPMGETDAKRYLEQHLGYRLFLSELDVKRFSLAGTLSGDGLAVRIRLCNTGYAPLPEKYRVYVTVDNGEKKSYQEVELPELYQICNGESVGKELAVPVPEELLEDTETLVIGLKIAPDAARTDGRDCVELANDSFSYRDGVNQIVSLRREAYFWRCGE